MLRIMPGSQSWMGQCGVLCRVLINPSVGRENLMSRQRYSQHKSIKVSFLVRANPPHIQPAAIFWQRCLPLCSNPSRSVGSGRSCDQDFLISVYVCLSVCVSVCQCVCVCISVH